MTTTLCGCVLCRSDGLLPSGVINLLQCCLLHDRSTEDTAPQLRLECRSLDKVADFALICQRVQEQMKSKYIMGNRAMAMGWWARHLK